MTGWIKICGMTTAEAVDAALQAGVDAIGFVFAPSPRRVSPERAAELARTVRQQLTCVAVTQHPGQQEIDAIVQEFHPDLLQTDIDDLSKLRLPRRLALLPVVRTLDAPLARVLVDADRLTGLGLLPPPLARLSVALALPGTPVREREVAAALAQRCRP